MTPAAIAPAIRAVVAAAAQCARRGVGEWKALLIVERLLGEAAREA